VTEEVRPAGARLEGWALLAATLAVLVTLTLYVRANGREDTREVLYDWQVSAFDGLAGADQAIYNSLYTVKDEIPIIFDDINAFNPPGTKFRWPNLKDFEDLQHVDLEAVKVELLSQEELFLKLAGDLPKEMVFQRELLVSRL